MLNTRTIYKRDESVPLLVVFDPGLDVVVDLIDETDVVLASEVPMIPSTQFPGLYRLVLTPGDLDGYLGASPTDRLVIWRARPNPAVVGVDDEIATFYRGGHVDLPVAAYIAPFTARIAPVDVPARFVVAGQIDSIVIPIGYGRQIRRLFEYVPGSGDVRVVVDVEEDA